MRPGGLHGMRVNKKLILAIVAFGGVAALAVAPGAYAQQSADSKLTQTINAGALDTYFTNASGTTISAPSFVLASVTASTTATTTATGNFGSDSQRITVDNPGASDSGFSLALAAEDAAIGWYASGSPSVSAYKHNGATASAGQLSVTSAGTTGNYTGGATGITGATTGTFTGTTPITIMAGSASSANVWRGYVHSIGLSQVIPASTPAGSYSIDLVQTVTAL